MSKEHKSACCHASPSNIKTPIQKSQQPNYLYTCPMHPEVVQNHFGHCPACGMALESKTILLTDDNPELKNMLKRFWFGLVLSLPLFYLAMSFPLPTIMMNVSPSILIFLQFILSTAVIWGCGWPILQRGYVSVKERQLNMFTLISLGVGVAYFYSLFAFIFSEYILISGHSPLYFEASAVIIVLVLLGQVLELKGRDATSQALRSLLHLVPKQARKVETNGDEVDVSVEAIKAGDRLRLRPGEKIAVDGVIIQGHGIIDESLVTGEVMPVEKSINAQVTAGAINVSGSFIMQAVHVGQETLLAQIVQQVANAQRTRAPIQRLADLLASYFVPVVIAIAIMTFLLWIMLAGQQGLKFGFLAAISVLVIACPCALGLATPMSIMVGMGRGAKSGILIKDAESLEQFERVQTLVVDKTGTLTLGRPTVQQVVSFSDCTEQEILSYAASVEQGSEHPLADAIIQAAKDKNIALYPLEQIQTKSGKGVIGKSQGRQIILGNSQFLADLNIPIQDYMAQLEQLSKQGKTVIWLAVDQVLAGLITIHDPIKSSSKAAIAQLKQMNMNIIMLTGDHFSTAWAVANELGIDEVQADVLPQHKYEVIRKLRAQGLRVAMAGDGINDAAALAEADIGIAMGSGTDIAKQSAHVTLVQGDLMGIVHALHLSRLVMRNIRQNLFLAFVYNIACIPIAAGLFYPFTGLLLNPMFSAAAMSLSSVSVIINALRLRSVRL